MFNPLHDQPGYASGGVVFLLGLAFFPSVFYAIQHFLKHSRTGARLCQHYKLKAHGVYDISNKLTSSTFALLACACGLYVTSNCGEDVLKERFYILPNYLIFGLSYFFYDCVTMYMVYSTETSEDITISSQQILRFCVDRPLIIIHHILVPLVGFPAMMIARGGQGDCILGTAFLVEASTPFVSLRVILCHLGLKDSRVYVVNGLFMLVTFFVCRVTIFPVLYVWYVRLEGLESLLSSPIWVHCAVAGLWCPQLFWFAKMLKGSIKLISDAKHRKQK